MKLKTVGRYFKNDSQIVVFMVKEHILGCSIFYTQLTIGLYLHIFKNQTIKLTALKIETGLHLLLVIASHCEVSSLNAL